MGLFPHTRFLSLGVRERGVFRSFLNDVYSSKAFRTDLVRGVIFFDYSLEELSKIWPLLDVSSRILWTRLWTFKIASVVKCTYLREEFYMEWQICDWNTAIKRNCFKVLWIHSTKHTVKNIRKLWWSKHVCWVQGQHCILLALMCL